MPAKGIIAIDRATTGRRYRIALGKLPDKLWRVSVQVRQYRTELEDAVTEVHGQVSVYHAHAIDTAAQAEQHCGLCRWILREKLAELTPDQILHCSREILLAKQRRDAAVERLGINGRGADIIATLYRRDEPDEDDASER